MAVVTHSDVMSLVRQYALARITQNATTPTKRQRETPTLTKWYERERREVERLELAIADALTSMPETGRLAAAVDQARHLNGPLVKRLRTCATGWDGAVTVYPPEARELVALIDSLVEP